MFRSATTAVFLTAIITLLPFAAYGQQLASGPQFSTDQQSTFPAQPKPDLAWQPPQQASLSDWSASGSPATAYSLPVAAPVQPAAYTESAVIGQVAQDVSARPVQPAVATSAQAPSSTASAAASAAPAAQPEGSDRRPIPLRSGNIPPEIASPASLWQSLVTTVSALALVCGVFVGIMLLTKRFGRTSSGKLPLPVYQLLGRSQLAPRHQILLIRFGSKLLLVSSEAGRTQTLAQIDEPEEVDRLAGLCQRESADSASQSFQQIFATSLAAVGRSRAAAIALCLGLAVTASTAAAQDTNRFAAPAGDSGNLSLVDQETSIIQRLADAVEENNRLREREESGEAADGDSVSDLLAGPQRWVSPDGLSGSLQILSLLTVLSLAPAILLMTTCYVRVIIVLGLLRQALGSAQLPPSQVITSISLFVTLFVMTPVWNRVYQDAVVPYSDPQQQMSADEAWRRGSRPVRDFMAAQISMAGNQADVDLFFSKYAPDAPPPKTFDDVPLQVLLPAYMISELKTAFTMGFAIYLPFLILDLVVASITISMGMMMLPPAIISAPFKLLLFVLVDGWHLIVHMLIDSFGTYPYNQ